MKNLRFSVDDVLEALRSKDIFYLEEACLAIVETTGAVNVYKDPNANTNIQKMGLPRKKIATSHLFNSCMTTSYAVFIGST